MSKSNTKYTGTILTDSNGIRSAIAGARLHALTTDLSGCSTRTPETSTSKFGWWGFGESVGGCPSWVLPKGKQTLAPDFQIPTVGIQEARGKREPNWVPGSTKSVSVVSWNILQGTSPADFVSAGSSPPFPPSNAPSRTKSMIP